MVGILDGVGKKYPVWGKKGLAGAMLKMLSVLFEDK